ncbi:MAG TPA: polysaccharide deacetylase family protein [bacterium]|nr:polysaccharide deacetylase family protein [bacterium]
MRLWTLLSLLVLAVLAFALYPPAPLTWAAPPPPASTPSPTAAGKAASAPVSAESTFTVLCYHRFIIHPLKTTSPYLLPVAEFRAQMQYLKDNGFTPITVDQLTAFWDQGTPLPPKPVLLTFDDGFKSVYDKAFPVLKEFHYPGVLFLISSFLETGDIWDAYRKSDAGRLAMDDAEIKEMQRAGLVMESHTVSHPNLGVEAEKRSPAEFKALVARELGYPIDFFKSKFGSRPELLAYPYGVYNDEVLRQAAALYHLAFTVNEGPNDRTVDPYKLRRDLILAGMPMTEFAGLFKDRVLHIADAGPGDGQVIWSRKPIISIKILDDVDPASVSLNLESRRLKIHYDPALRLVTYRVETPIRMGGHQMTLRAKDLTGQSRVYSWYFRVKHRAEEATPTPQAPRMSAAPSPTVTHDQP